MQNWLIDWEIWKWLNWLVLKCKQTYEESRDQNSRPQQAHTTQSVANVASRRLRTRSAMTAQAAATHGHLCSAPPSAPRQWAFDLSAPFWWALSAQHRWPPLLPDTFGCWCSDWPGKSSRRCRTPLLLLLLRDCSPRRWTRHLSAYWPLPLRTLLRVWDCQCLLGRDSCLCYYLNGPIHQTQVHASQH